MNAHHHRSHGRTFRIEVTPGTTAIDGCEGHLFVARIARLTQGGWQPVCNVKGGREVYGPTERWAIRNAAILLDTGAWRDAATPAAESWVATG